jgi:hypothetical protein
MRRRELIELARGEESLSENFTACTGLFTSHKV